MECMETNSGNILPQAQEIISFEVPGQTLSVECYLPRQSLRKAMVFYYGGGWMDDNRHRFRRFAADLSEAGYTVFLPEYRTYRKHGVFPEAELEDVVAGMTFAKTLCERYGIEPGRMSVGGASAGGHLVLCAALLEPYRSRIGVPPEKIVLFNPVCCTCSINDWVESVIGIRFPFEGMCPLHGLGKAGPPILAMHGTDDEIAPAADLESFAAVYAKAGGACSVKLYPGRRHGFHHPEQSEADYRDTLQTVLSFLGETPSPDIGKGDV